MSDALSTDNLFITPYYIEQLGCDGLSNYDIAKSLNAQVGHVNRRIKTILSIIPELSPNGIAKTAKGSKAKIYLPTSGAKMIVAKYDNEIGISYLRYLLKCEQVATEVTPKLIAEIKRLQEEIATLQAAQRKQLPKASTYLVTTHLTKQENLFGEETIIRHRTRIPKPKLSAFEMLQAKLDALIAQNEGVSRAIQHIKGVIDYMQQGPAARLRLLK